MKYSVAAVSAFAAVALAKPEFLNSSFQVEEGVPFTLKYSGCDTGCTITLQTGASNNLKDVKVLTSSATGASTTVTLEDLPSGIYSFKITDKNGDFNYSTQFPVQGSAVISASSSSASSATSAAETNTASGTSEPATTAASTTAASTTAEKSTTLAKSTTAHTSTTEAESTTTSASSQSSAPPKHNSTTVAFPTSATTTTGGHHSSTTASTSSKPTVPPGSAAGRLSSPIALVAGVALVIAFFS